MTKKHYILATSCALLLVHTAPAQDTFNWSGLGLDGDWSSGDNWQGGLPPNGADILSFAGVLNTVTTNDLTAYQGHRIIFQTTAGAFTLGGNALTLFDAGTAAPKIENLSIETQTIDLNVTLDGSAAAGGVVEINPVNGDLIFNGTVTLAEPGNSQLLIFGNSERRAVFNGVVSGDNQITLRENSIVELNAANTYTGSTVLDAGTVRLGNAGGLGGTTAGTVVNAGGTLDLNGQAVGAEAVSIAGSGSFGVGALINNSATVASLGGVVTLTAPSSIGGLGDLTLNSGLAGTGHALTKTGPGVLTLTTTAARTGQTRIAGGTLSISNDDQLSSGNDGIVLEGGALRMTASVSSARAITLEAGSSTVTTTTGTTTWTGAISGAGGFTKDGAGTLALQGSASNTNGGVIQVNQGTLRLENSTGNAIGAGGLGITSNNVAGFGAATVLLGASNQIDDNAPITIQANGGVSALLNLNDFTETVGPITISSTTFGGGVIRTGANGTLILNGDLTMNNNRNAAGNTAREVLITGTGTPSSTGIGIGGTLDLGGVARRIIVNTNNTQPNNHATIETVITNGTLVKDGAGVLRVSAANTYAGGTVINQGTLLLNAPEALPTNTSLTITAPVAGTSATLNFGATDFTLTAAHNLVFGGGAGSSNLATTTGTLFLTQDFVLDVTNNPTSSTINGRLDLGGTRVFNVPDSTATAAELQIGATIIANGDIVKTGSGALSLRGQNPNWIGNVLVNEGTLRFDAALSNNAQFTETMGPQGNGIFLNGTTVQFAYNTTGNVDRTMTGHVINIGATGGTIDVQGAYNDFTEGVYTQIRLNAGNQGTILRGTGTFTKSGGGRLSLQSASPDFSGPVVIENGTLEGNGSTLGNASATNSVTVNGGNWAITGDVSQAITLSGGALSVTGASRVTHGNIGVTADSRVFLNNFWTDASGGWNLTMNGVVTGSGNLLVGVNRPGYDNNTGSLILTNAGNTLSGEVTVQKGLGLTSNPVGGVGSAIGTASVNLQGGRLILRDNGTGNGGVLTYGNDIVAGDALGNGDQTGVATIDVDRAIGVSVGNVFRLGTLDVNTTALDVISNNRYGVEFAGLTTFTASPTINVSGGTMTLAGGLSATGQSFVKNGIGTLRILGAADFAGYTLNQGTLEVPTAPAGTARDIALPLGTGFSAGYAATQANLIDRVTFDSAGVIGLGVDSTFNPDFTGFTNGVRLGGTANATLTGTITPADNTVRLGGGGGTLTLASTNAVSGTVNLDINTSGTAPGIVSLAASNNFTGIVSVGGGMTLRIQSLASLGTNPAPVSLNDGTLQLAAGGTFAVVSPLLINAGAGGGTLDTNGNNIELANGIQGVGPFTKAGNGNLTLTAANATYNGAVVLGGGSVTIGADTDLGLVPSSAVGNRLQFDGGELIVTADLTIPTNRGISLTPAGGTIDIGGNNVTISSVMAGPGSSLTKQGAGTLILTANNTYTGLTTVEAGTLQVTNNIESDVLVKTGATFLATGTNSIQDGRTITLDAGSTYDVRASDTIGRLQGSGLVTRGTTGTTTLQLNSGTPATFDGIIENGTGVVAITKGGGGIVTLTGTNTQTGTTSIFTGQIRVEGPVGRLSGGGLVSIGDNNGNDESLMFGNNLDVVNGVFDRVADASQIEFRGSVPITFNGPAATSTVFTETMGEMDFREAAGILTLIPAPGGQFELVASTLNRQLGNGSAVIRGTNLGATGADSSRVRFEAAPAVVGSGGTGSQASIIPFIMGGTSATAAPNTFVRYDAANGVVPLGNSDYEATLAGSTGRNVSLAGGETLSANGSVNAIRVTGGTTTLAAGTTLELQSGAVLFTADGSINGPGAINGGPSQIVLHASADNVGITGEVNANLQGSGGVIVGDAGNVANTIALGGNNTFVGGITINGGILRLDSAGALNSRYANDLTLRAGNSQINTANSTVLTLNGNDAKVIFGGNDRLQGSTRIQNASATPVTLTVITNVTSDSNDGIMQDGTGGGALSFVKAGAAQLSLEQNNNYTGSTNILGGNLRLRGGGGAISATTEFNIHNGTLTVRNEGSGNVNSTRIPDAAPISLHSGRFNFESNSDGGQSYSENAGPLRILSGANTVAGTQAASGRTANVSFDSLERMNSATVLNFTGTGLGTSASRNRVWFEAAPVLENGIIGAWATLDGDFASYALDVDDVVTGDQSSIVAATYDANSTSASQTAWTATSNIRPSEALLLTANRSVNTVNFAEGIDADLGGFTLNSQAGGMIVSGTTPKTISNGTITAGTTAGSDFIIRSEGATSSTTIAATIADNSAGAVGLIKTGAGRLVLGNLNPNTYTGRTLLLEGTLAVSSDNNLGAVPAAFAPGNLVLNGGTLGIDSFVTLNANRGILVGTADSSILVSNTGLLMFDGTIKGQGAGSLTINGERLVSGTTVSAGVALMALTQGLDMDGAFRMNANGSIALTGATNRVGGAFQVGIDQTNATINYNTPGGSLSIGGTSPDLTDFNIGYRPTDSGSTTTATVGRLDLTGSENLTVEANNVRVGVVTGVGGSGIAQGQLVVGTNSSITAVTQFVISDSPNSGNGTRSDVVFGSGTNTVITPLFTVGGRKGNGAVGIAPGGTLNISGFASGTTDLWIARNNQAGTGTVAQGSFDLAGGTLIADLDELVIGHKSGGSAGNGGANGSLNLDGNSNQITANSLRIGERLGDGQNNTTGVMNFSGGSLTVTGDVGIGLALGTATQNTVSGTLNVFGGNVTIGGDVDLAIRPTAAIAAGTLSLFGGTMTVGGNITTTNDPSATAFLSLEGGTLDMTNGTVSAHILSTSSGGLNNVAQIFQGDGTTPAPLNKTSSGILTLGGTNAYTGATNVDAGTLLVSGSLSGTTSVNVASGATFGGTGSVNPAATVTLANGSTLAPGLSPGALSTGNIIFGGGTFELELVNGSIFDQLLVAGTVKLDGPVALSLELASTFAMGQTFTIIDNDSTDLIQLSNGALFSFDGDALGEGDLFIVEGDHGSQGFTISYSGGTGNDVVLTAVPEPGSAAVLLGAASSLLGLGRFRRRR